MFSRAKRVERSASAVPSIISADMKVNGDIVTTGEVQIDGQVDGDVKCGRLTVGETGNIKGMVNADQALVRGRIEGQIEAGAITLAQTAKVKGDVVHETLTIDPGAHIEGLCRRVARQARVESVVRPAEAKAPEVKPVVAKPPEAKTFENKPFEPKPVAAKIFESKPADSKPTEPKIGFGVPQVVPKPA
jgi:cytoskeletal protein CcmA (bactofilin family)